MAAEGGGEGAREVEVGLVRLVEFRMSLGVGGTFVVLREKVRAVRRARDIDGMVDEGLQGCANLFRNC